MPNENLFDLIEVRFENEIIAARPFEFHTDQDGNLLSPIKASTSCPFCGHGNEIDLTGWKTGSILDVQCNNCGAGQPSFDASDSYHLNSNVDTVFINRDLDDIEKEVLEALSDADAPPKINVENKGSITIDMTDDVHTLKSDCPFVDPIEMGIFVLDEI